IDFLVVKYGSSVQLFRNQRDGSFKEVAEQVGIKESGKTLGVGSGDLNKDGFTDFYFLDYTGLPFWYLSDGRGGFVRQQDGKFGGRRPDGILAQVADYDNDGLLDVVELNRGSLRVRRNIGGAVNFDAVFPVSESISIGDTRALATGDINGDGAVDLVIINNKGEIVALKNEGASKNYAAIALTGKTSN